MPRATQFGLWSRPTALAILGTNARASRLEGRGLAAFEDVGESGYLNVRKFCPECGSPIMSEVAATPELEWLKAGTLDDPSWLRPQMNMWCDSAQPWVSMDDDIPAFEGNPPLGA